jgi:hypothetical protein
MVTFKNCKCEAKIIEAKHHPHYRVKIIKVGGCATKPGSLFSNHINAFSSVCRIDRFTEHVERMKNV